MLLCAKGLGRKAVPRAVADHAPEPKATEVALGAQGGLASPLGEPRKEPLTESPDPPRASSTPGSEPLAKGHVGLVLLVRTPSPCPAEFSSRWVRSETQESPRMKQAQDRGLRPLSPFSTFGRAQGRKPQFCPLSCLPPLGRPHPRKDHLAGPSRGSFPLPSKMRWATAAKEDVSAGHVQPDACRPEPSAWGLCSFRRD